MQYGGRLRQPSKPPDLRRGVRLVYRPALPERALLRSEPGLVAGAAAADGGPGVAGTPEATARGTSVGAAAVRGTVRGGGARGV